MIARIGRWCFLHRRSTLLAWFIVLVGIGALGNGIVGNSYSSEFEIPASESATGFEVLDEWFPAQGAGGQQGSIVFSSEKGVAHPDVTGAMTEIFARVSAIEGVTVLSPYDAQGARQVNVDGTIAYATVNLEDSIGQRRMGEIGSEIVRLASGIPDVRIEVGGNALVEFHPPESELIGLGFAIIVLILAFGSVLAMGLPIGVALFGVGTGASLVALVSHVVTIPDFATSLGAMIGIAVGIDYSLFIVTRYREMTRGGATSLQAIYGAMDTAGRAVVFAGMTVVVSLLGMLLIGLEFVAGLGIGAATTVAVTMVASVTLLPALVGFARERIEITRRRGILAAGLVALSLFGIGLGIDALLLGVPLALVVLTAGSMIAPLRTELKPRREKPMRETMPYRWSRFVQRRPRTMLAAGTAVLLVLAAPVLSLRLGFADEGNFSEETTTRRAYDLLAQGFGPGFNGPFIAAVEVDDPSDVALVDDVIAAVAADPNVVQVSPARWNDADDPRAALFSIVPRTAPQDEATADTVRRLRADVIAPLTEGTGASVHVTGATAASIDFTSYLADRLIVFIGVVLLLSFVLLMAVFRSLLVPAKAVVMNVLSIASAYGVVVAVFQWGWLSGLFGAEPAPIEPFVPMMMFAIVFGLSMDYEVFLLSRVKEEFDRTGDPRNSVADGLAATARVITAAAAIMVVVFGAFLLEDTRVIKLFGVGLSVAVLLDATLVRMLLVPATMELLGARNWWLPAWLDRILPRLSVEGPAHADTPTARRDDDDLDPDLVGA